MTELVFILDRSGSMSGLEKDTIGGFNSMLEKQCKEPGEAVVSTVLFDDESEVIHDRIAEEDIVYHHHRWHGKCKSALHIRQSSTHDRASENALRLGIYFPWRQY